MVGHTHAAEMVARPRSVNLRDGKDSAANEFD
jgi:hypothetical protein